MKYIILLLILGSLFSCTQGYKNFRATQKQEQVTQLTQKETDLSFTQSGASISWARLLISPSPNVLREIQRVIWSSKTTLRVNLYLLSHQEVIKSLIQASKRGVDVRVILEKTVFQYAKVNRDTFEQLKKWGVSVAWASETEFNFNHAKYFISDTEWIISTGNATKSSYGKNREFFIFGKEKQVHDELVSIFDADFEWKPLTEKIEKLSFSPINARTRIESSIQWAKKEILVFSQSISDEWLLKILSEKKKAGIRVQICVGNLPSSKEQEKIEKNIGNQIIYIPAKKPYVHAKSILIDGQYLLVWSMNFTTNSLDNNREIGLILRDSPIIQTARETIVQQCGAP